jgi:hypothetical protein
MPYEARSSFGTDLKLKIATVYTSIAGVSEIDDPTGEPQLEDVTGLNTGKIMKDKAITGYVKVGQVSGKVWVDMDEPSHADMCALQFNPSVEDWRISHPTMPTEDFKGILTKFAIKRSVGKFCEADFTIDLTDEPTYT